jgi:hypothetical protein
VAEEYEKKFGKKPARIRELLQAGLLRGIPADPLGYAYELDENGKAELNLESPLLEQQLLMQPRK